MRNGSGINRSARDGGARMRRAALDLDTAQHGTFSIWPGSRSFSHGMQSSVHAPSRSRISNTGAIASMPARLFGARMHWT